jgi:MFS family permease
MKDISKVIKYILAPLLAILLVTLGNGFFLSFTSLRLNSSGHGGWIVGFVHSAYYFGMLVGAARAEKIINQVGHIRAYAAYTGIGIATLMIQGLTPDPIVWIIMRTIMGFCLAVYYIVVESWFLSKASPTTRGAILSLYMITLYFAQSSSQFILNFIDLNTSEPFLLASLLGALSAVPLALTKAPAPNLHEADGYSLKRLFQESRFGFLGCLISGMILSSIYSFGPLFAETHKLSVGEFMGICILGGVILQWPVGKLSDIFDRRRVLFAITIATVIQSILMIVADTQAPWVVYTFIFVLGGLVFTLYPLSITHVCDRVQPEAITKATGMLLLAYGVGAVLGPVATPVLINAFPSYGLFVFLLICAGILSVVGIHSFLSAPSVPEDKQNDYVSLPSVSPVAYELDPRIDQDKETET